jgi:hypothetical protein
VRITFRTGHLERFAEPGERGHVFIGPKGGRLRRSNFRDDIWNKGAAQRRRLI